MPVDTESKEQGAEDTEQVLPGDAYAGAFDEASKLEGEGPDVHAADDPNKVKDDAQEKIEDPVEKPIEKPIETSGPDPSSTSPDKQPGESEETYKQRYLTLQGIVKHDKSAWEQEKANLMSQLEEAKKPTPSEKKEEAKKGETDTSADAFIESLTPEQQEQLKQYEADFDVVSKMEGIKRSRELAKLRKELLDTVAGWKDELTGKLTETQAQIAPAVKMVEANEVETHFNTIRNGYRTEDGTVVPGHPDFEKLRDAGSVVEWIKTKPAYLQTALKKVYEKGTAMDVIDLFSDFKRENNIETPIPSSDNVVNLNAKRADKKAALSTVQTRRGAINTGKSVADDFAGAFDEASNK